MAGRIENLRPYRKGQSGNPKGKPKGAKDKVPRSAKRAVELLIERFGTDTALLEKALRKGLEAKAPSSFPYLKLVVEQSVGAPEQPVTGTTTVVFSKHE